MSTRLPRGNGTAKSILEKFLQGTNCKNCGNELNPGQRNLCKTCAERAELANRQDADRWAAEDRQRRTGAYQARMACVPALYRASRFTDDAMSRVARWDAVEAAKRANGAPMVTLTGASGSGKTTLAAAMFGAVIDGAIDGDAVSAVLADSAMWTSAIELARTRREYPLGSGEAPLFSAALTASYLVIDDIGMEQRDYDVVAEIIYERHANMRPTVITTGLAGDVLEARYNGGIVRRIGGVPHATVIRCDYGTASEGASE